jgi:hypothetical protein
LAGLATPLVALAQTDGNVGARISSSAVAAQSLQGPLDGTWALEGARGRTLYVLQIVDPVTGRDLQAAWRQARSNGRLGTVTYVRRRDDVLSFGIDDRDQTIRVSLRRGAGGVWRGQLHMGGGATAVRLRRPG